MAASTSRNDMNEDTHDDIFEIPSDFSDWSDSEFDALVEVRVNTAYVMYVDENDEDDEKFCVCDSNATVEMISCDNDNCHVKWWHYGCAGLTASPKGSWLCAQCRSSGKKETVIKYK